jgi:hypothetical protein
MRGQSGGTQQLSLLEPRRNLAAARAAELAARIRKGNKLLFGASLRTSGDLSLEAKRFIVEVYEKTTGKRLL